MTHRLFEEKHHASIYQRYRFVPPEEIRDIILQYLERKVCQEKIILLLQTVFYMTLDLHSWQLRQILGCLR